jgi:uncharacterized membrane protein
MAKPDSLFVFVGTYPDEASARDDYDIVKDLHALGAVGSYDAAVITKEADDKVHVHKDETATRHGAWAGLAVGALAGLLFPPSIIATSAIGAAVGGVGGHLWRGMSRHDMKELGELIDEGEAELVVVGQGKVRSAIEEAELHAEKDTIVDLDVDDAEFDRIIRELAES